ncbi:MAG: PEP-CTERM sorting domain-containing protein [Akkermansiaceae bacterium]
MKSIYSALLSLAMVTVSSAAIVITPTSATSTTSIGGTRTITAAIDSTGLDGVGDILDQTHDGGNSNTHWLSNTTNETVTFDLGGGTSFDVDTIYLWTYNRPERNRGVRTFDIAFSTDGGSSFGAAVSAASLGLTEFNIGTNNGSERSTVQTRSITKQTGVTDIQITNITNWGDGSRIAIPEIRFGDSVPEPSSVALISLAGLGFLIRRRK